MARPSSDASTKQRGTQAEALARAFLEHQGYRIITSNHRCQGGEVDIIAWDGSVLCFIEVRSRANDDFGEPLETIDRRKIARIARAARDFIATLEPPWPEMRFDAVGIIMEEPPRLTLVRGAFEASGG